MDNTKVNSVSSPAPKRRKKAASLDKRKAHAGWVFVAPFLIGFVLIYLPIIFDSIKFSFHEIDPVRTGGYTLTWVGLNNYQEALFVNPDYVKTLISGIQQLILEVPSIVIFSLFIAVLLNDKIAGRAAFRAILFVPVICSTGLISSIDNSNSLLSYMNNTNSSIDDGSGSNAVAEIVSVTDISWLFGSMAVGGELVSYVVGMINNIYNIINRSGVQMLIFLAGLQSISPAIYESCSIDGASGWETFWKITIPMISPMILVNTIYTIIDSFTSASNSVMNYISAVYDQPGGNVLSSAMSWMYFLIVVGIIAVVAAVLSAYIFYQKRD